MFSFNRQRYIVQTGGVSRYALRGQPVDVLTYRDGSIELVHSQEELAFKVFEPAQDVTTPVDNKRLTARVDALVKARQTYRHAPDLPRRRRTP